MEVTNHKKIELIQKYNKKKLKIKNVIINIFRASTVPELKAMHNTIN